MLLESFDNPFDNHSETGFGMEEEEGIRGLLATILN
jgi:hypothetical protein